MNWLSAVSSSVVHRGPGRQADGPCIRVACSETVDARIPEADLDGSGSWNRNRTAPILITFPSASSATWLTRASSIRVPLSPKSRKSQRPFSK